MIDRARRRQTALAAAAPSAASRAAWRPRRSEALAAMVLILMFAITLVMSPWATRGPEAGIAETFSVKDDAGRGLRTDAAELDLPEDLDNSEQSSSGDSTDREDYPVQNDDSTVDSASAGDVVLDPESESQLEELNSELEMEAVEVMDALRSGDEKVSVGDFSTQVKSLGNLIFSDAAQYESAPDVRPPVEAIFQRNYRGLWYLQKVHDQFFEQFPHKLYIPHLDQPISRKQFHEVFRQTSTPVVMKFEHLRNLGVLTRGWTIKELRERFPYQPKPGAKKLAYHAKAGLAPDAQLDLGPALYELEQNNKLSRGAKGTTLRNFPRNLMIKPKYLSLLDATFPPFLPRSQFQVPTLWMGTTTADTKLHHDCCDNFVMMIAGTKRWTIAPPSETHELKPVSCTGKHQSLCWSSVKYPNDPNMSQRDRSIMDKLQYITLDLKAGEMLYLPSGWWHHIENLDPTVMVNFWTRGCSNSEVALDKDPTRSDRPDFNKCPRVASKVADFINMA